ncbi:MAG TPA: restriction endonuclease subunit S [bacterium]|nr:restriction endonuclease subunit S [bacterium]
MDNLKFPQKNFPINETASSIHDSFSRVKQTEVENIPVEWSVLTIAELFDFMSTASNSREELGITGYIAYVHYGDIHVKFNHFIDFSIHDVPYLLSNKNVSATRLQDGDLIVVDASEDEEGIGKTVEVCNIGNTEAISGLHTLLLRSKDQNIQIGYRRYIFESLPVKTQLRRLATGLKVYGISKHAIKDVHIPLPTITEQRAIAEALSNVDGLIGALGRLIAKKRAIKQAAMQQLLTGKTRLPGFEGEWETKRLGQISHIKTGSRNNEDKVENGQYPFFVRSDIVERINTYSYDCEAILIPGEGRIGSIFHYICGRFDVHQRVYAINQFASDIFARYILYYMTKNFGFWAMQNTVKATVDSLRLPTFLDFEIKIPKIEEQIAIATVLSDIDDEISALMTRRDKTKSIKQGMMQQLLTGRIRLVKPEETK